MTLSRKIVYGSVIAMLLLVVSELVARLALPFPIGTPGTYVAAPDVLYFHRPSSVGYEVSPYSEFSPVRLEYNDFGFRGTWDAVTAEKPLIVLLGDSFIEARQVRESETAVGKLSQAFPNYHFLNAGCSAYTTTTEFLLLRNRVLPLEPDRILLFFTFNDYADNFVYQGGYFNHPELFGLELPPPALQPTDYVSPPPPELLDFFSGNSALVSNLARAIAPPPVPGPPGEIGSFQESFMSVNTPTDELDAIGRRVLEFTHQGLLEIARLSESSGIPLTVFIIPLPMQVAEREWSPGRTIFFGYPDGIEPERVYQDRLLEFCRDNDIECVDMLPEFQAAAREDTLYLSYDGHWTSFGNAVVANVVSRVLSSVLGAPEVP